MFKIVKQAQKPYQEFNSDVFQEVQAQEEQQIYMKKRNIKIIKKKYCSLCKKYILNEEQHLNSRNHKKFEKDFYVKYKIAVGVAKQHLQKRPGYWGLGQNRKKMQLFNFLYNFEI